MVGHGVAWLLRSHANHRRLFLIRLGSGSLAHFSCQVVNIHPHVFLCILGSHSHIHWRPLFPSYATTYAVHMPAMLGFKYMPPQKTPFSSSHCQTGCVITPPQRPLYKANTFPSPQCDAQLLIAGIVIHRPHRRHGICTTPAQNSINHTLHFTTLFFALKKRQSLPYLALGPPWCHGVNTYLPAQPFFPSSAST